MQDPKTTGWRRAVLPASLILNLFFVALVGAHLLRAPIGTGGDGTLLARALANAEGSLAPNDAASFKAVMQRDAPRFAQAARQLAAARDAVDREVSAEHLDPAATRQALATWRVAAGDFADKFSDSLIEALTQISPDGRRRLVAERRQQSPEPHAP